MDDEDLQVIALFPYKVIPWFALTTVVAKVN